MDNEKNNGIELENKAVYPEKGKREPLEGPSPWQAFALMLLSAALAVVILLAVLKSGKGRYALVDKTNENDTAMLAKLLEEIENYYYFDTEAPSRKELAAAAAHAMVKSIGDPYAEYYTEEEYNSFRSSINGNYKGIGIQITAEEGRGALVHRAYENNPAYDAGVREGDYIVAVDGKTTIGLDASTVSSMIAGEDATVVTLGIVRGETELTVSVTRGDVYVKRVYSEKHDNGIGYIRIDSFTGWVEKEFDEELERLLADGIRALIVDVRNDPGGELDKVVAVADRMLPECTVTTLEGKTIDPPKVYSSTDEKQLEIPYVVLTNGGSASASEILASAVQDNKAGTILGTTTYGKGVVQTSWELLPGEGYIKLTTDVYLTPNGSMIHGVGVTPDVIVEQDPELEGIDLFYVRRDMSEKDVQFKAAVELLLQKLDEQAESH